MMRINKIIPPIIHHIFCFALYFLISSSNFSFSSIVLVNSATNLFSSSMSNPNSTIHSAFSLIVKSKSLIQVAMDVFAFGFLLPLAVVGWVSLVIHLIMNGIPGDVTFGIYG